jgi:hypothetical protein
MINGNVHLPNTCIAANKIQLNSQCHMTASHPMHLTASCLLGGYYCGSETGNYSKTAMQVCTCVGNEDELILWIAGNLIHIHIGACL